MTPTPDTTPAAVEAMIERLLAGDLCTVELAPEAAAMLREVARENERLAKAWHAKHAYQVKEAKAHREYYEKSQVRMQELAAEAADTIADLRARNEALCDIIFRYVDPCDVLPEDDAIVAGALAANREG